MKNLETPRKTRRVGRSAGSQMAQKKKHSSEPMIVFREHLVLGTC